MITKKFSKSAIIFFGIIVLAMFGLLFLNSNTILADDDDDDKYEERDREDDDDDKYEKKKKKNIEPVKSAPVPQISPQEVSPAVPEAPKAKTSASDLKKISDSDTDGIADLFDAHPGEDDFIYKVKDRNSDGIADDLEFLKINR